MKNSNENVNAWLEGKKFSPLTAELHLTDKCNLCCLSCWRHNHNLDNGDELPDHSWIRLTNELISLGVEEFYLCGGGEPMVRKDLALNLIKKVKRKGLSGMMTTNCTLFDEGSVNVLISEEWDHLQVSIDGGDSKTQDFLRGKECVYKKNVEILKMFHQFKKELRKDKPKISIHTVLSNKNYMQLKQLVLLASELGVKEVNLQELVQQSKHYGSLKLNYKTKEVQETIAQALKLAENKEIQNNFYNFLIKNENINSQESSLRPLCFEPWNRITILSNGLVKTCCNPSKITENTHKKSLEKIWYGRKFKRIRKKFYQGKLMKECCTHPNKR